MENKKTIIGIIILIVLISALIVVSYFYNDFNTKQKDLLTEEANKILGNCFVVIIMFSYFCIPVFYTEETIGEIEFIFKLKLKFVDFLLCSAIL